MVYTYELPNITNGFDTALTGVATAVPSFIPMLLVFIYFVTLIGGAISQKKRTGVADMPLWSTIAGLMTLVIALPMSIVSGFLEPLYLIVIVVVTLMSGVWLFLDHNRNEIN